MYQNFWSWLVSVTVSVSVILVSLQWSAEALPSQSYEVTSRRILQQSPEETKYMKYHKCKDTGEAYGAAYFITKEHLVKNGIQKYNLTWVNCEMGSFTFMNQRLNSRNINEENLTGVVIQSLDVSA